MFPLISDVAVLICNRKLAKNWRDQEKIKFVGYRERDLYLKEFLDKNFSLAERKRSVVSASINSHKEIVNLVQKRGYLAVLPESSALRAQEKGQIEIVLTNKKRQNLCIICHEHALLDKKKKAFLDFLLDRFVKQS